jgi:hypothetical protein
MPVAAPTIVALTTLALAGCSVFGSDPSATTPAPTLSATSPAPTPSASHTPLEPGGVYVDVEDSQGEGDFVGAFPDVADSTCAADGAAWVSAGTLVNPAGDTVDYRVWAAFLDPDGDTVGLVQANVDGVSPGATGAFSASMPYDGSAALTCVLRVERRTAAS